MSWPNGRILVGLGRSGVVAGGRGRGRAGAGDPLVGYSGTRAQSLVPGLECGGERVGHVLLGLVVVLGHGEHRLPDGVESGQHRPWLPALEGGLGRSAG